MAFTPGQRLPTLRLLTFTCGAQAVAVAVLAAPYPEAVVEPVALLSWTTVFP